MSCYKEWTTSCIDWKERIINGEKLVTYEPHFPMVADIAEKVFKELIVVDVTDSPKMGEITRQWVYDFVRAIFGCFDPIKKKRLIREFFLLISKKNTKSTLAAGIMLTALILNERASAELVILAPTKEVADNSFIPLRDFIRADPELDERFSVSEHTKTITDRNNSSVIKVIAADSNAAAGKKSTIVLIDEVWLFGKRAQAESLFREAKGGLASRPEGCVIYLSTMSDDVPCGVFKSLLEYARGVRDGEIDDPTFLPMIFEFPKHMIEAEQHLNPKFWYITNPNLGASVDEEYLKREFLKVKDSKTALPDFLAKHLNIEIGLNLRAGRWAGGEFWLSNTKKGMTLDWIIENSDLLTIGGDGGGLDDLLGFAVLGRDKENPVLWYLWTHAWCHEIVLERRKSEEPKLRGFEKDGDLTIYSNIGDDIEGLCEIISKCYESGKLSHIGLDPAMLGSIGVALDVSLEKYGIDEDELVIGVPQGFKMMTYIVATERRLAEGNFKHCGTALMVWVVGNAKIKVASNGIMITKQESGIGKIDPLIASLNAVAVMLSNPKPKNSSPTIYFW